MSNKSSKQAIISLDIGSSSIRCSLYRVVNPGVIEPIEGCASQRKIRTVEPNTGRISLKSSDGTDLMDEIDKTVDDTLLKLRNSEEQYHVAGLGFSTFCMNFIALDQNGKPVDEKATLSYACNSKEVADECKCLKR